MTLGSLHGAKIFVVATHFGTVGGGAVAPLLLCRELVSLGVEVTVFAQALTGTERDTDPGYTVIRPPLGRGCRWDIPGRTLALRVTREIRRQRPDFVFVCGVTKLARYLLRSAAAHQLMLWEFTNATRFRLVDREAASLLGRGRCMLSPSAAIDGGIRDVYGYRGAILRFPFWVEDPHPDHGDCRGGSVADFIYLGRRDPEKGLFELVEATAMVARRVPSVRVLVAGPGSAARYEELAVRLGCADNVAFRYFETVADTSAALCGSRCLVLPSHHEGYPLVLLEAAALGVPFVATDVGSVSEIFRGTGAGWIVQPEDPRQLARAMMEALEEDEAARSIRGAAAREVYEKVSGPEVVRRNLDAVLMKAREVQSA